MHRDTEITALASAVGVLVDHQAPAERMVEPFDGRISWVPTFVFLMVAMAGFLVVLFVLGPVLHSVWPSWTLFAEPLWGPAPKLL